MSTPEAPLSGVWPGTGIGAWVLLIVSAMAVLTRLLTKWSIERTLHPDDMLVLGAFLASTGSVAAVHVQSLNGLAISQSDSGASEISNWMKAFYAMELLYLATLCLAKLSIIALLRKISPDQLHRRLGLCLGGLIVLGSIVFGLTAAFQCQVPEVWNIQGGSCLEEATFWRLTAVFEILLDIGLVALPLVIVIPLNMKTNKKFLALSSFSARVIDIAAAAIQLSFTQGFVSSDPILELWEWVLLAQITQCVSIVTSCVPFLRPFLESMSIGFMLTADMERRADNASYGRSYNHTGSKNSSKAPTRNGTVPSVERGTRTEPNDTAIFAPQIDPRMHRTNRDWYELRHGQGRRSEGESEGGRGGASTSQDSQLRILEEVELAH